MKSVLVVVTRQIGDVLLTTPLVHEAKRLWPGARITVLGFAGTLGMLQGNPDVDERIEVPPRLGFGGALRLMRKLWRRYDLALVADPGDRAHILGWIAARTRAGLLPASGSSSNWWKRALLAHAVESAGDLSQEHVVAEKLRLLAKWQEPDAGATGRLVGPAGAELPAGLQAKLRRGYVVMHTPSMWPYKQWPIDHFQSLAARLAAAGRQVVLTGSGGEHDRACVAAVLNAGPESVVDAGLLSFGQLAALIRGAALYIGPDTSVSHLAAACEVPVLAIFGPTNPQRWAPWPGADEPRFERQALSQSRGTITLVQADLPCVPCGKAGCEDHRQSRSDCLRAITPERVAAEALRLLGGHECPPYESA